MRLNMRLALRTLTRGRGRPPTVPLRLFCRSSSHGEEPPQPCMLRHLTSKIKATGPISVAEYMKEVLTNPVTGYYVRKETLGADGDFITSPEVSQVFGELIGVWVLSEWMAAGRPPHLQLVELGPGTGALSSDVLRVLSQLRSVLGGASVSLHLVEVSPALSRVQAEKLTVDGGRRADGEDQTGVYHRGETKDGLPVSWYRSLGDVPAGFTIFLAHEFFDALPVHKFQRTSRGWREVMVDLHPQDPQQLSFVLAPAPTLASSTLVQVGERRDHVEVCAEGGAVVQQLAARIYEGGGAALIADYGHDGTKTDTFRGFKGHRLHGVLQSPGAADLTADVDFSFLRLMAGDRVSCLGPVPQRSFLKNMGVDARMQVLWRNCSADSERQQLVRSYDLMMEQMGQRFLFFCLLHPGRLDVPTAPTGLRLEKKQRPAPLPVAGFSPLGAS